MHAYLTIIFQAQLQHSCWYLGLQLHFPIFGKREQSNSMLTLCFPLVTFNIKFIIKSRLYILNIRDVTWNLLNDIHASQLIYSLTFYRDNQASISNL